MFARGDPCHGKGLYVQSLDSYTFYNVVTVNVLVLYSLLYFPTEDYVQDMTPFQLEVLSLDHTNTIFESEFHFFRLETGSGPFQQYEFYNIT